MNLSKERLLAEAAATGFRPDTLEKTLRLLSLLTVLRSHPFLKERFVLKGGTALNLFVFVVPRLSVDAVQSQQFQNELAGPWVFAAPTGGPFNISNLTRRVYYPALRGAELIERSVYCIRHTFAIFVLDAGENPG